MGRETIQLGQTRIAPPESTTGFMLLAMWREQLWVSRVSRDTLNMIVHVTQRVSMFCNDRHGCRHKGCSVGHLIHCSNAVFAVFGKMSRCATKETLSIGIVGVFPEIFHYAWAVGSFLCLSLWAVLCPCRLCLFLCPCL